MTFSPFSKHKKPYTGGKKHKKPLSGFRKFIQDDIAPLIEPIAHTAEKAVSRVYNDSVGFATRYQNMVSKSVDRLTGAAANTAESVGRGVEDIGKSSGFIIPALAGIAGLFFLSKQ